MAAAPGKLVGKDFSGDAAFKGAIEGKLTIIDAHASSVVASLDPKSKGWTAAIGVPVKVGDHVEGVLISYLKWSRIENLMAGINVGKTGYVYALNHQNQVVVHPRNEFYGIDLRDRRINLPGLGEAVKKHAGRYSYEFRNIKTGKTDTKLVGFADPRKYGNFPGLGWRVAAGANKSEVVAGHPFWKLLFR